jgi:hypothetical protein
VLRTGCTRPTEGPRRLVAPRAECRVERPAEYACQGEGSAVILCARPARELMGQWLAGVAESSDDPAPVSATIATSRKGDLNLHAPVPLAFASSG